MCIWPVGGNTFRELFILPYNATVCLVFVKWFNLCSELLTEIVWFLHAVLLLCDAFRLEVLFCIKMCKNSVLVWAFCKHSLLKICRINAYVQIIFSPPQNEKKLHKHYLINLALSYKSYEHISLRTILRENDFANLFSHLRYNFNWFTFNSVCFGVTCQNSSNSHENSIHFFDCHHHPS